MFKEPEHDPIQFNSDRKADNQHEAQPRSLNGSEDTTTNISITIRDGFGYYFLDFLNRVQAISSDLSENEFWANPFPYGNSIGHLILHITGNLNYYIGAQLASTGYIRDRPREFTENNLLPKAEVIRQLEIAVDTVIRALGSQSDHEWATPYTAEGVDDVHDRFSIFLRCIVHFHHHIGHMSYTKDEHARRRGMKPS